MSCTVIFPHSCRMLLNPPFRAPIGDFPSSSGSRERSQRQDEIERGNHRWMNKKYPPPGSSSSSSAYLSGGGGGAGHLESESAGGGGGGSGASSTVCLATVQNTPVGSAVYFSGDSMDADQRQRVCVCGVCMGVWAELKYKLRDQNR